MKRSLPGILFFVLLVAAWELLVKSNVWPRYLLPSPSDVVEYLARATADGTLPKATWITIKRLLLGYVAGLAIGIPLGVLTGRIELFRQTIGWLALGLQALPSICWAPLSLLWFGQTEKAMLFIVLMGSVWSVMLATEHGVRNVPKIYVWAARTMGSKGLHTLVHVIVPAAFPFIVGGMKQGWAFAWRSLMAAEIYVTIVTGFGLGHLLHYGRELHAMDAVIGIMLVIVCVGLITDKLIFAPIERTIRRKWGADRS